MLTQRMLCCVLLAGSAQAGEPPWPPVATKMGILLKTEFLYWRPALPGLPETVRFAALEGNPSQADVFTVRLALPAHVQIRSHTFPHAVRATVLSGSLSFGFRDNTRELSAGDFWATPAELPEAFVALEDSIVQLSTTGPWALTYVGPRHDPGRPDSSRE